MHQIDWQTLAYNILEAGNAQMSERSANQPKMSQIFANVSISGPLFGIISS